MRIKYNLSCMLISLTSYDHLCVFYMLLTYYDNVDNATILPYRVIP